MKKILMSGWLILTVACSSEKTSTGVAIDLFDTAAYLASEFENQSSRDVTKTISYNEDREVIEILNYDLTQDLAVFNQANINNPNWVDKYTVDSVGLSKNLKQITYRAVDPKLQTRQLTLTKENGMVKEFVIKQEREALISDSSKTISYSSGKGYQIATTSKNLITQERTISIDVEFR